MIEPESNKEIKKSKKLSRNVLNMIRTTMRNNIELTHIADNKANIMISVNSIILSILIEKLVECLATLKKYRLAYQPAFFVPAE